MKKSIILSLLISFSMFSFSQEAAKAILNEVSAKMGSYTNMQINFSQTLSNEDAGIKETDEAPIQGIIKLEGEKYNLEYQGNTFIYDGKKLSVINLEEKEISVSEDDLDDDDGFIYPSKLLTFYKQGYNLKVGKTQIIKGKKIQFIILNPINETSEIAEIELGINIKTKHIYKLNQLGKNGTKTIFTIDTFKSNQNYEKSVFSFDEASYLQQGYLID